MVYILLYMRVLHSLYMQSLRAYELTDSEPQNRSIVRSVYGDGSFLTVRNRRIGNKGTEVTRQQVMSYKIQPYLPCPMDT
jgi:hypothetical protein